MYMEKVIHELKSWGSIEVNLKGKVLGVSPDFLEHFSVMKDDVIGKSIMNIIQTSLKSPLESRDPRKVFSGVFFDMRVLLRLLEKIKITFITSSYGKKS